MAVQFTFTRNPSTKVSIQIEITGLVPADNELTIIGREAVGGGTATVDEPVQILAFGDEVAAKIEVDALFGDDSEVGEMVVAAIEANKFSDLSPKVFPTIKAISMANASIDLAATLAANISLPMPFVAQPFPITNASIMGELRDHLKAISGDDRGVQGQFGSFGFMASLESFAATSAASEAAGDEVIMVAWLRDLNVVKAQAVHKVAAALAAVCAANGSPFLPLNGISIGKLLPPTDVADRHTGGDAGTTALGLESGAIPLETDDKGNVVISRSVTSRRPITATPEVAYFDMQDWQGLYFYRKNAFIRAQQPQFKRAKGTDRKAKALLSELLFIAKDFETLEIFQKVDELADQFKVFRTKTSRDSFIYEVPVNVVPGFHNKGIGITGTTQFDSFEIA